MGDEGPWLGEGEGAEPPELEGGCWISTDPDRDWVGDCIGDRVGDGIGEMEGELIGGRKAYLRGVSEPTPSGAQRCLHHKAHPQQHLQQPKRLLGHHRQGWGQWPLRP